MKTLLLKILFGLLFVAIGVCLVVKMAEWCNPVSFWDYFLTVVAILLVVGFITYLYSVLEGVFFE